MKLFFCALLILFTFYSHFLAQDAFFTQNYANRLNLNPALTGIENNPILHVQHRNQWPALSSNFLTTILCFDQKINAINSGIGVILMHDSQVNNAASIGTKSPSAI